MAKENTMVNAADFNNVEWDDEVEHKVKKAEKIPFLEIKNGQSKVIRILTKTAGFWVHCSGVDKGYWALRCGGKGNCIVCDAEMEYEELKARGVVSKFQHRCGVWNKTDNCWNVYDMGKQVFEQITEIIKSEPERKVISSYDLKIDAKKGRTPYYNVAPLTPKPLDPKIFVELEKVDLKQADAPLYDAKYLSSKLGNALTKKIEVDNDGI